jgi:putative endonuclease
MPKVFTSKTQKIGKLGETIAKKYLLNKGFIILEQNYTQKQGEIDIIAKKESVLHFIEVKSIVSTDANGVSREISIKPEENMTFAKYNKIERTVLDYIVKNNISHETEYQIDLLCVYLNQRKKEARIKYFEKINF